MEPGHALERFLTANCPEPTIMRDAFLRHHSETVLDRSPGDVICEQDDLAEACWLILRGTIEIVGDGKYIGTRVEGELIGEQAFLKSLVGNRTAKRTATLIARSDVSLLCIDAAFHEKLSAAERSLWFLTLAVVVNDKLEQATRARAELRTFIEDRDSLLSRFADDEALGIVKRSIDAAEAPIQNRNAIVWFSDIANFSAWGANKPAEELARVAKSLTGVQVEQIRAHRGYIDKIMGDGVMAFWFVDTPEREQQMPLLPAQCAKRCLKNIDEILKKENLSNGLDIRVGMHCGPVAFGDFGVKERIAVTLLGTTVNLAARFEQACDPDQKLGRVRLSSEFKRALDSCAAQVEIVGPTSVRVKKDQISVYCMKE